jgi:hypothetical protein
MLIGALSPGDRQKIMTICTIEVHNRDVVTKLISQKVENSQAFTWLSQLRHRWDDKEQDCFANICDAQFRYSHEYLGNTTRLVITPLTDRYVCRLRCIINSNINQRRILVKYGAVMHLVNFKFQINLSLVFSHV